MELRDLDQGMRYTKEAAEAFRNLLAELDKEKSCVLRKQKMVHFIESSLRLGKEPNLKELDRLLREAEALPFQTAPEKESLLFRTAPGEKTAPAGWWTRASEELAALRLLELELNARLAALAAMSPEGSRR